RYASASNDALVMRILDDLNRPRNRLRSPDAFSPPASPPARPLLPPSIRSGGGSRQPCPYGQCLGAAGGAAIRTGLQAFRLGQSGRASRRGDPSGDGGQFRYLQSL